jgi:hypothetical protein
MDGLFLHGQLAASYLIIIQTPHRDHNQRGPGCDAFVC